MISIYCRTNLDLEQAEKWPEELPEVPRVGDYIVSAQKWKNGCQVRLIVVSVTWKCRLSGTWVPEIELSLGKQFESLNTFYDWYGRITGKGKHAYI